MAFGFTIDQVRDLGEHLEVLFTGTDVGANDLIPIDLNPKGGDVKKLRLDFLSMRQSAGDGTTLEPEVYEAAGLGADDLRFSLDSFDSSVATTIGSLAAMNLPIFFPEGIIYVRPQSDGATTTVKGRVIVKRDW